MRFALTLIRFTIPRGNAIFSLRSVPAVTTIGLFRGSYFIMPPLR